MPPASRTRHRIGGHSSCKSSSNVPYAASSSTGATQRARISSCGSSRRGPFGAGETSAPPAQCEKRRIGNAEPLGLAAELQGDGEEGFARRQVPVLVLQHDGHFVRVLAQQILRARDARRIGLEGDIEVVRAGQALGPQFDLRQFHHAVLRNGAIPLTLLDAEIERWTAAGRTG